MNHRPAASAAETPPRRLRPRRLLALATAGVMALTATIPPAAAQRSLPLVRDAETEALMRDYAAPIFDVAGIARSQVDIILVNKTDFNAFVADARRIFINIGVILDAETPGEVIGVLAHETGHITGNHLVRMRQALANAQLMAALGILLGAGAVAAGASAGSSSAVQGGAGALTAGAGLAQRTLLAYRRGEESVADRAAITFLEKTGQSAKGMLKTFSRFADQALFSAKYTDPYAQSHPMPRERLNALETLAKRSRYYNKPAPTALQARHDMVRAKLLAFTSHPNVVARAYPSSDRSLAAEYARAVVSMRTKSRRTSVKMIDALISRQPDNPYFHELKGQALLESGSPKAAIAPFRKALSLRPREAQFMIWLGFALVASNDNARLGEAEKMLKAGLRIDPNSPIGYSQLAIAHGRQGEAAEADLATARGLMARGDFRGAKRYATRARKKLKRGTPAWLQADDIVSYQPPKLPGRS
ncbi:M48 family metalloprotease [Stappia indica]|uniref:M48 family metalloprotease n=1 Tax=Stappia indica TaxID=538381 RepID=UPI001CD7DBF5|nr:M48 family metalloprotease [Stappia indica]MCA1298629.1 M48 family metalloprotease [Stappia indica]